MTDAMKQEYTRRISQANPTELTVVIYDIALEYIEEAEKAITGEDPKAIIGEDPKAITGEAGAGVNAESSLWDVTSNIRRCLNELIASLHYEYQPAGELRALYKYCLKNLSRVNLERDAQALAEIKGILSRLRDAFGQVAHLNGSGAVMSNSQSVYAGLTYGASGLVESSVGGHDYSV